MNKTTLYKTQAFENCHYYLGYKLMYTKIMYTLPPVQQRLVNITNAYETSAKKKFDNLINILSPLEMYFILEKLNALLPDRRLQEYGHF